jgi:flagellar hook-associated protein 2
MAVGSTGTLSSPGLGSGLDVNSIVAKLVAAESRPLTALKEKEASVQAKISAFGTLKSALATFQTALGALTGARGIRGLATSVGDSTIATVTAGSTATAGAYSLEVTQLAQAQKLASSGFAGSGAVVGSGTLTFEFGSFSGGVFTANPDVPGKAITIGAGANTLAGIRDAVNAAAIGVTASIVSDGSASGAHLVFTSTASGAVNSLRITAADADGNDLDALGLSQLAYDPAAPVGAGRNLVEKVAAQNALFTLDGIAVSKTSNTVTDVIEGVALKLQKTNPGAPTTIDIAPDDAGMTAKVQAFVDAYNALSAAITKLTAYDATTGKTSTLTGNATARSVESQVRAAVGSALSASGLTLTALWQAGVTFKSGNQLTVDASKLDRAIGSDAAGVAGLFAAMGEKAGEVVGRMIAGDGAIATATDSANRRIKDLERQQDAMELRLERIEARYLKQFQSLDRLLSSMSATSTYLTQQLANLPGVADNGK